MALALAMSFGTTAGSSSLVAFALSGYYVRKEWVVEYLLADVAVAMLSALYGMVLYLLLLPIRSRLEEIEE